VRRAPPALGLVHLAVALALAVGCGTEARTGKESPPMTSESAGTTSVDPLEAGPFVPARPELFGPPYYPETREAAPARSSDQAPGADELGRRAEQLVGARDAALVSLARELYADPRLEQLVPHPALRAAVVSLLGTLAEPAIEWLLEGGRFALVDFGELDGPEIAQSQTGADGRQRIVVASRLAHEEPGLLSVVIAHEALHADDRVSDLEELVATALQALVHMQQLLADPALAEGLTELAQTTNAWVLIRFNTRAEGSSTLRLVLPDGGPSVLPGGLERPYFAAFFDPAAEPTPGNPFLAALVAAVAVAEPPPEISFDVDTIELLDAGQAVLSEDELLRVADPLDLDPPALDRTG
jgi:hypothetical protein